MVSKKRRSGYEHAIASDCKARADAVNKQEEEQGKGEELEKADCGVGQHSVASVSEVVLRRANATAHGRPRTVHPLKSVFEIGVRSQAVRLIGILGVQQLKGLLLLLLLRMRVVGEEVRVLLVVLLRLVVRDLVLVGCGPSVS